MAVEKVSANIPLTNNFVLAAQSEKSVVPQAEQKKGNKNVLWWALGGLAVASTAGILIYNARKGRVSTSGSTASATASFSLGAFAKKFADETIFTKSLERAKNNPDGLQIRLSEDNSIIELCDDKNMYGCQLISKFEENAQGKVSEFEFATSGLNLKVENFNNNVSHLNYMLRPDWGFTLKVDSNTGKVIPETEEPSEIVKSFIPKFQKIVDELEPKKLLDDGDYRTGYVKSLHSLADEILHGESMVYLSEKTGKSVDELNEIFKSKEFEGYYEEMAGMMNDAISINIGLQDFNKLFAIPEAIDTQKVIGFIEGKNKYNYFEDFVNSNLGFKYSKGKIEDGQGFVPRQVVNEIKDLSHPDEVIKIGDATNGKYYHYERYDAQMEDYCSVRYYEPTSLTDKDVRVTEILTPDRSMRLIEDEKGVKEFVLKLDGEELSPEHAEKIGKYYLSVPNQREAFIRDFIDKGKEIVEQLIR